MTIEEANVIDLVGMEASSGTVVLTIADHMDWVDQDAHLRA